MSPPCPACQGRGVQGIRISHKVREDGTLEEGKQTERLCPRCGGCGADTWRE